ncbi:MAG: putative Serine-type D-Ala-D-Ala carboxypeptidase [Frankiales bacterium]|nr:putative Serine-type D-Ala-D-Ala carboxypeptidase [Frankiales bacterium]
MLGADLPLVDDAVTVEHLLTHTSGIGDYFDEDAVDSMTDYVMPVPVHRLVRDSDGPAPRGRRAPSAGHVQVVEVHGPARETSRAAWPV